MAAPYYTDPYSRPVSPNRPNQAPGMPLPSAAGPRLVNSPSSFLGSTSTASNYGPRPNSNYSAPGMAGNFARPSSAPGTPSAFAGMPRADETPLMGSVKFGLQSAPMQSPQSYLDKANMGAAKIAAAGRMQPQNATPANPIQVTEQQAREMFSNAPGNTFADKEAAFHGLGQQWGFDSHGMLDKWRNDGTYGQTQFPTGGTVTTPGAPGLPMSMVGAPNSAGNSIASRLPGMSANEAGMNVGATPSITSPAMSTAPGYTPMASTGTGLSDPSRYAFSKAAALPQAYNDQDHAMIAGENQLASLPPMPQQVFNANNDLAQAYANAPVAAAQAKGQASRDINQDNVASREKIAAGNNATSQANAKANAKSRTDAATINANKPAAGGQTQEQKRAMDFHNGRVAVATTKFRAAAEALRKNGSDPVTQGNYDQASKDLHDSEQDREKYLAPSTQPSGKTAGVSQSMGGGQLPGVASQADYDALPNGAQYTYNGQTLTKGQKAQ